MTRTDILNQIIKKCGYTTYLEIGVQHGVNFKAIECEEKVGVDPEPLCEVENPHFIIKDTSDEFFNTWGKGAGQTFDLIFIDGLHHADQVQRDFENSLEILSDNGTIVFHDCNPPTELHQRVPRQSKEWNGDVWKAWVRLVEASKYLQHPQSVYCIDTDFGVGIYTANDHLINTKTDIANEPYEYEDDFAEMSYEWLDNYRKTLLNLISVDEWKAMVGQ